MSLKETFEKHEIEFLKFERIENPLSVRPDLHAFLLLDQIVPPVSNHSGEGYPDMVCSAAHDEIWLTTDTDALAELASEEQIIDLIRCGVRYDDKIDSLCMFA